MPRRLLIAMLMVLGLLFVACGDDGGDAGTGAGAEEQAEDDAESGEDEAAAGGEVLITAVEYEFDLPDELQAGPTTFTLKNAGEEKHFIDIVKLTDDAPEVDKLIKMPERKIGRYFEGQPNHLPTVKPGETGEKTLEIDLESGRYGYVCFIAEKGEPPHAFLGMRGEFTVP